MILNGAGCRADRRRPAGLETKMTKGIWLATVSTVMAGSAFAQTSLPAQNQVPDQVSGSLPGPDQSVPSIDPARQGVLVFEPAFFRASRPTTALDMVLRLPGFGLELGDSDSRGLAGTSGNVLIDGDRPTSKTDTLNTVLQRIAADGVERVELIRGGAPGIDMQGRSVIANVVLKRSASVARVLEFNTAIYSDGFVGPQLAGQYSRREGDNLLEASFTTRADRIEDAGEGFRRRYDEAGNLIQDGDLNARNRYRNARGTLGWQGLAGGGRLKLNGLLGGFSSDREQDLLIRWGAGIGAVNTETRERRRLELGGNWIRDISPTLDVELVGLHTILTDKSEGVTISGSNVSIFSLDQTTGESIARAVLRIRPSDAWALETGAEAAYNFLDSAADLQDDGASVPLPSAQVKVEELRGEVFGQATWRPDPRFTLEGGVRIELSEIRQSGDTEQSKSFVYPKPRLQATWTPSAGHQFRVRIEREVDQLDFADFVASADIDIGQVEGGNPDVSPQRSTILEGVYERRFWGEGAVELTASHARIEDVVDIIPLTGGFEGVGNIGDGTSDSLRVRLTLPTDKLGLPNARLQANGDWSRTEVIDPVTGGVRRFQGDQSFKCRVAFDHDLSGGKYSYGFIHGCSVERGSIFRVREVRREVSEPIVAAYWQWKPYNSTTVRLDLSNITDNSFGYDRDIYAGSRDGAPLQFTEVRRVKAGPSVLLQVRRTF